MNLKPETIQTLIELSSSIGRAYFDRYKALTWGQDLRNKQAVNEYIELLIKALQEDAMWQVAQWKEEREYIKSLEAQVKAILKENK
jgi:hypothetical protein